MKNVQQTNYSYNWKILIMVFLKISKTQQLPPKTPKTKFKKSKRHVRGPQEKKCSKQTIVRIKKYEQWHIQK